MIIQIMFQYIGLKISIALAAMLISVMDEMSAILKVKMISSSLMHESQFDADSDIGRENEQKKREPRCIIETICSDLENALYVQKNPP